MTLSVAAVLFVVIAALLYYASRATPMFGGGTRGRAR